MSREAQLLWTASATPDRSSFTTITVLQQLFQAP